MKLNEDFQDDADADDDIETISPSSQFAKKARILSKKCYTMEVPENIPEVNEDLISNEGQQKDGEALDQAQIEQVPAGDIELEKDGKTDI